MSNAGRHRGNEIRWDVLLGLNEEQWERLRITLCSDASEPFIISMGIVNFLLGARRKAGAGNLSTAWYDDVIQKIQKLVKSCAGEDQPVASTSGAVPPSIEEAVNWDLFYSILAFSDGHDPRAPDFVTHVKNLGFSNRDQPPTAKFTTTLADILDAGLEVESTSRLDEHFMIVNNNKVKLVNPNHGTIEVLNGYPNNKVAVALKIETLGPEIFASISVLYDLSNGYRSNLLRMAQSHELMPEALEGAGIVLSLHEYENTIPKVLASRVLALQQFIRRRNSWWPSLKRDMSRNRRDQPYLFWGGVLAIFFGVATVIQTVTSVISCYYSILAYRAVA